MPPRLIVNADDFGLTPGINRAIAELHAAGAVSSATLMATGPAFADAVTLAHAHPTLGIGCHIVLTDGTPASPPETIPTLLGPDRRAFRSSLKDFVLAALLHRINPAEVEREAIAQIRILQRAGIQVTHLDTHKHTGILPGITGVLLRAAAATDIGALRNPFEPPWSVNLKPYNLNPHPSTKTAKPHPPASWPTKRNLQLRLLGLLQHRFGAQQQIRSGLLRTTAGTLGIAATGRLDAAALHQILAALPEHGGTYELVCHPGYNDRDLDAIPTRLRQARDLERRALLAVLGATNLSSQPSTPQLIHYGSL